MTQIMLLQSIYAIGNIAGGLIGAIQLSLAIIGTGITWFIAFIIGLTFAETKVELPRKEKTNYKEIIADSLRIIKNNRAVLWFILFFAVFNSFIFNVTWFKQPYLQNLGIPVIYFGVIFAAFSIVAAIGSSITNWFDKKTKQNPFLVMGAVGSVVMLLIGTIPSIYIFTLWSLFSTFMLMNETLTSQRILGLIPVNRAVTVLSFANLVRRLFYAATGPILGWISDSFGLLTAIQTNAVLLLVSISALLLVKNRFTDR